MITPEIIGFAEFHRILEPVIRHGVATERKTPLYEAFTFSGAWEGFAALTNRKGKIRLNLIQSDKNPNRQQGAAAYFLQCRPAGCHQSFNLSGLRLLQSTEKGVCTFSGEPYPFPTLKNGDTNPLFHCRNDGFLFFLSEDKNTLDMLILAGQRSLIDAYRNAAALGVYDAALDALRSTAIRC